LHLWVDSLWLRIRYGGQVHQILLQLGLVPVSIMLQISIHTLISF
jgi:hypothetical protein